MAGDVFKAEKTMCGSVTRNTQRVGWCRQSTDRRCERCGKPACWTHMKRDHGEGKCSDGSD